MKNTAKIMSMFLFAILCGACKKEKAKAIITEFKWVADKNIFHYDSFSKLGIRKDFRNLEIGTDNDNGFYFLEGFNPGSTAGISYFDENIYGQYVVKSDGLYKLTRTDCGVEFFNPMFDALFAPNTPFSGQQVPVYYCKNNLYYYINIAAINQTVSVPYGTFKTYVMQFKNGDQGYVDPNNGLIMYISVDSLNKTTDTLKLSYESSQ